MELIIAGRRLGRDEEPFIIAEMSGNHNQSLDRALAIVQAAADTGAHAIKLQTYTADTLTLDCDRPDFIIHDENSLWNEKKLYDLYHEAHTPWEWHQPIMEKAKDLGLICFSTPFDESAVDFLETLDSPAYKVASFESTDVNLLKKIASTGKPVVASTGMATVSDLALMVDTLEGAGCSQYALLKCTSAYPASPNDANLRTIPHMAAMFGCEVGLSDHTMGIGVPVAAISLGASIIEKHFCLSRDEGGVDSAFSLEPEELRALVLETKRAWQALGKVSYGSSSAQEGRSKQFRRSLYFSKALSAGSTLDENCFRSVRPGYGLPPRYYDMLLGRKLKIHVDKGMRVSWDVLV